MPNWITGADGAQTTTIYDLAGRKTELNDPDKGLWKYVYNPLGELLRQLDGKNQAIDFTYDNMGRVTHRRELTGTSSLTPGNGTVVNHETITWTNSITTGNGKGQVLSARYQQNESGSTIQWKKYFYDGFGRLILDSNEIDGIQLSEETTYDQYGRVFQQFDASGDDRGVRYHYNARGYVEKLQEAREGTAGVTHQQILTMDARGHVLEADLNDRSTTTRYFGSVEQRAAISVQMSFASAQISHR